MSVDNASAGRTLSLFRAVGEAYWLIWRHRGQFLRLVWIWLVIVAVVRMLAAWSGWFDVTVLDDVNAKDVGPMLLISLWITEIQINCASWRNPHESTNPAPSELAPGGY